jgi:hypothetical protein
MRKAAVFVFLLVMSFSCNKKDAQTTASEREEEFQEIPTPANIGSGEANLFTDRTGTTYLSWVEKIGNVHVLKFSTLDQQNWSEPIEIARGEDWFVNWADFPMIASDGNGNLAAHYLAKTGAGTYAYGVHIVLSNDNGKTWSLPIVPHEKETETEHGFVSMIANTDGFQVFWLDGRATEAKGPMSIRTALIHHDGTIKEGKLLDDRVCDCCQTSAFQTAQGPVIAYRDRSEKEVRDISIVRYENGSWTAPENIHEDGWEIKGCPVNGPSVDGIDEQLAIAWFTAPNVEGESVRMVKLMFSEDQGENFSEPLRVDDGNPLGRVDVKMMDSGNVFVSWMEQIGDSAELRMKKFTKEGKLLDSKVITSLNVARSSGFPQMELNNNRLLFVWRDISNEEEPIIRTALMAVSD